MSKNALILGMNRATLRTSRDKQRPPLCQLADHMFQLKITSLKAYFEIVTQFCLIMHWRALTKATTIIQNDLIPIHQLV